MTTKSQSTTEPIEVPERIWIAPTTIRKREGRIYLAPGRTDNEIEYRVHVPADSGNVEDEPDIYDLVADYRDRIGMQTCAHCANPITGGATPNTWVHIGTGLTTCRKYGASAHEGIFNAEPATTARVSASVAPTVNAMWEALKAECCKVPEEAQQIVFLTEKKFRKAISPFVASTTALVEFVERPAAASPVAPQQSEPQYLTINGQRRMVIPCPDGIPGCEVLHTAPAAIAPSPVQASVPSEGENKLCLLCGHYAVAPDGTCMAPVPICSDDYHGTRRCGCKCRFKTAPAPSATAQDEAEGEALTLDEVQE